MLLNLKIDAKILKIKKTHFKTRIIFKKIFIHIKFTLSLKSGAKIAQEKNPQYPQMGVFLISTENTPIWGRIMRCFLFKIFFFQGKMIPLHPNVTTV